MLSNPNVNPQIAVDNIKNVYPSEYRKQRYELVDCKYYQPCRMFLREKLEKALIMNCRISEPRDLKKWMGFNSHNVNNTKKKTVLGAIIDAF